jgi:hypothetical protein
MKDLSPAQTEHVQGAASKLTTMVVGEEHKVCHHDVRRRGPPAGDHAGRG